MEKQAIKRQLSGIVTSDKMDKSVVVQVERIVKHPLYKKYIKRRSRFVAHDEGNQCKIGDKIVITASRPISKTKRWYVSNILEKAV
ncbi:MAG: 30S ribosomal protein S17 [Deltaproteobacteria bacterium]|jgi:small subunit ribosomal protein S17|nr:30S ribosomal protein S17 [Deltaproteobacteria bacterium]